MNNSEPRKQADKLTKRLRGNMQPILDAVTQPLIEHDQQEFHEALQPGVFDKIPLCLTLRWIRALRGVFDETDDHLAECDAVIEINLTDEDALRVRKGGDGATKEE